MLPEDQVTQNSCSAEPRAPGQGLGLPLSPSLPPRQGETWWGRQPWEGVAGAERQRGEAGLIYEASNDGTTWQGGHK